MRAAVVVEVGERVDLGGDGVPVQTGERAGLGPAAGVVGQDGAFPVPGHLADREHGIDVCWHASNSLHLQVDQGVDSSLPKAVSRAGYSGPAEAGCLVRQPDSAWVRSLADEQSGDHRQQMPSRATPPVRRAACSMSAWV